MGRGMRSKTIDVIRSVAERYEVRITGCLVVTSANIGISTVQADEPVTVSKVIDAIY